MNKAKSNNTTSPKLADFTIKIIDKLAQSLTNTANFGVYFEPIIQLFSPDWKLGRIRTKITAVRSESKKVYTIVLKPNSEWLNHEAGQYLQLSAELNGALITRTFSISSEPNYFKETGEIELTIRSQDKGLFTPWLQETAKTNLTVYVTQASGDFTLKHNQEKKLFIAAGSGITAIRPILKQFKDAPWMKHAELLFYVKNSSENLFLDDLNTLKSYGLTYQYIYSDTEGRVCQQHLDQYCTDISEREAYVCGPPKMIETTRKLLESNQVKSGNIYFEYFGAAPLHSSDFVLDDDADFIQIDYLDSKKQVSFKPDKSAKTLLEIAENEGLKPVSGCRIGVCHQCICKKKQGRVYNLKTQQYSDSGSEEIQLCLSVPVSHVELEL